MSAHGEFTHQKQARTMELIALLILTSVSSSCQLSGPKNVVAELGGSVTVDCRYDMSYKDNDKQWCKGKYYLSSSVVVSTDQPEKGGVSLTDNKTQGIFSVTMDHLTKSDEGTYWCVIVQPTFQANEKFSIELKVSEAHRPTMRPTTRTRTFEVSVTTALTTSFPSSRRDRKGSFLKHVILSVVVVIIFLLLIVAVIFCLKIKQWKKYGTNEQNVTGVEKSAVTCKFSKEDKEVTYSNVKILPKAEVENIYCNVQDLKEGTANGQDASETVEYSTLLFRS
uniref:CMRF35-like molecule 2 isoform X2 n=1 Tax=Pristiophorus japonicus TaxID=55135 RepID=UPI00398E70D4